MSSIPTQRLATALASGVLGVLLMVTPAGAASDESTAQAYREVLAKLGAGDHDAAMTALAALESAALPDDASLSDVERLWRSELRVIRDLLPDRPEVLVPILALHHEAYATYRDQRHPILALHARIAAEQLADVYAQRADTPVARLIASRVLTSLAGYVLDAAMTKPGADLLLRALDYDARNLDALLAVAAIEEKYGRYPQAVERLRRLLFVDPLNAEGRLRLALNLRRSGGGDEGDRLLAELARTRTDWIGELACEESAAGLAQRAKLPEAIALLRSGAERFPTSQRLLVQLSFLLERSGDRDGALDASDRAVAAVGRADADTPRLLYSRWPTHDLERVRQGIREDASQRLPVLVEALRSATANP